MGIALRYQTIHPVPQEVVHKIIDESDSIVRAREWWCEPLSFFQNDPPSTGLRGHTKLFLVAYSASNGEYVEVETADDWFMAYRDLKFIIQTLASWSVQYPVVWALDLEDEVIGEISSGVLDKSGTKYLKKFAARCKSDPDGVNADSIAKVLSDKYRSRME